MNVARIAGTLWQVTWRHRRADPLPGADEYVSGVSRIVTADPTGCDVYSIAERIVLGDKAGNGLGFTIEQSIRCCEVQGTAAITSPLAQVGAN